MANKNTNIVLYILAAVIVLVSARYVQVQVSNRTPAAEKATTEILHQLHIVTNDIYYADTDLIATVQLSDLQGQHLEADLSVSLLQGITTDTPISFRTDSLGRALIELPLNNVESGRYNLLITVNSELGHENFQKEIRVSSDEGQNFVINFDKGLYNPGDNVLFRILAISGNNAQPIAGREFTVSIFDGNNNRVYVENVQASDFGIISGRFSLGDEVNSGFYRLVVEHDGIFQAQAIFEVSPFVLPRFEIALQTDKSEYHAGETIYLTGSASYFFGEPVNQGTVTVYINDNMAVQELPLDESGEFTLSYDTLNAGLYNIWVEVIDNSNYRIEASLNVRASEGAFEVDVMPEHGYLVRGMPNTIYIFTHTPDGAPVRTYLQITGHSFSRQVATDDNGIGIFVLEDIAAENNISINAVDMDGNSVQKDFSFPGFTRNVTLLTNSPRYAMGETIYLNLNRREQGGIFRIYAYRNDRLLQIIETEHDKAELNIDDAFGLIDIYAVWISSGNNQQLEALPHARRTIFIDPGNYMQLTVQSNMPEYMPGEFVSLDIDVKDRAGIPLEAALLVSIVDEAMLSLAANDLSIDNIRLALEDIRFGEDLDAATLYASLIAGASEQAITRLLLRQGGASPFIQTANLINQPPRFERERFDNPYALMFRGVLNFLRIVIILQASLAFFMLLYAKRNEIPSPFMNSDYLPNAPYSSYDEVYKKGKYRAAWIVIIALVIFFFTLLFLSGCGSSDRSNNGVMMSPPNLSDSADSGDFSNWVVEAEEAPAEEPASTAPSASPEIETQTGRVRRLFLETMLFVPELIARNGHANLEFILADNITTWNIQVVGNTKDGIIGHTQSSIRAFQPFFVDFELPRNSIRYDRVSIPVTVFNYTEEEQTVILTIAELDWFELHGDAVQTLTIPSNRSQMVYVPITITQFGDFVFRAYADTHGFADAAERPIRVNPEGFQIRRVVSGGGIENDTQLHLLFMNEYVPGTRSAFISFYPSVMSQVIEGMENIFRMPFGCFEQTSSILYPNILALRYMQQNNIDNPALTQTALSYISSGYQRLLTFEVIRERGGFSLYGDAPAETLLTAYGLMQLKDLTSVYTIDENVLERMSEFLFKNQNRDGSFEITGRNRSRIDDSQWLAFNAYIIWALSETFPNDYRLSTSVEYLISRLSIIDDNYTFALIANVLVNTNNPLAQEVIDELAGNIVKTDDGAYITSSTRDYFGAFGHIQYLQTTALTSLALSNHNSHSTVNDLLINHIISQRDTWGTWHSTQATILSLKALTNHAAQAPLEDGKITVTIDGQQRVIDVRADSTLDFYQVSFTDLERENIIDIQFPNLGRMTYSVVQEFYAPYDSVELDRGFELTSRINTNLAVHELAEQEIRIINTSGDVVNNGLVAVTIPQGFRVERNSLEMLRHTGIIERYEFRFDNINLYLRDVEPGEIIDLTITYRPAFPVAVIGGHVRVFDYYNPMIEGFLMPVEIIVQ